MATNETSNDINTIMENIKDISEKKQLLLENKNPVFQEYVRINEEEIENRKQSIEDWSKKELDFAEKYMKCQMESINTDYEREITEGDNAIFKYINFKYRKLMDSFKQFKDYIDSIDSLFLKEMKEEYINSNKVKIERLVIPKEESERYSFISDDNYEKLVKKNSLMVYDNEEFDLSSHVEVEITDNHKIHGRIESIGEKQFKIISEGSSITIPFKSVNIGLVKLHKQ